MGALIDEYSAMTATGNKFTIQKGQLTKLKLRPQIINEHAESSREIMDVVESGVIVGQVFKASQDNINGIALTLESAEGETIDTFETYADTAALRTAWPKSGVGDASLEETVVKTGDKSMSFPFLTLNDTWEKDTVGSVDYTGYTFDFDFQQSRDFALGKASFFLKDGSANTASAVITVPTEDIWTHFEINVAALIDDGAAIDLTDIDQVGFWIVDSHPTATGYVDNLVATPAPGQVKVKLWDCGDTLPVGDGSSFDLTTDATQYTEIGDRGISGAVAVDFDLTLIGGKRLYEIREFIAGPAFEMPDNTPLTVGNYYAITLTYIDTDVSVYGPDTTFSTDYYESGYAFSTTAENVDITTIAGAAGSGAFSDLMFMIFSTQDAFIIDLGQIADATPGSDSTVMILAEDANMNITNIAVSGVQAQPITAIDLTLRPVFIEKGSKFELYYNDDFTDSVTSINLGFRYFFVPQEANG